MLIIQISSLELNIRQQILSDLAACDPNRFEGSEREKHPLASRVQVLRNNTIPDGNETESRDEIRVQEMQGVQRVYMVCLSTLFFLASTPTIFQTISRVQCNIAYGDMVKNSSPSYIAENVKSLFPTLLEVLNDVPRINFDPSLSWRGCLISSSALLLNSDFVPQTGHCLINSSTPQYHHYSRFAMNSHNVARKLRRQFAPFSPTLLNASTIVAVSAFEQSRGHFSTIL